MRKLLATIGIGVAAVLAVPAVAFAHVVVTPDTAVTGGRQVFSVSVPNEKEVAVTGLRLVIPAGPESVTPTVKPGWTITTKQDDKKNVTEISWNGGSIPEGQRDDFTFRAKLPATEGDLIWKAYQTYADGSIAAWDQKPVEESAGSHGAAAEESDKGPYSVTSVVETDATDDTATTASTGGNAETGSIGGIPTSQLALSVALASLIVSVIALIKSGRKHRHDANTAPADTQPAETGTESAHSDSDSNSDT